MARTKEQALPETVDVVGIVFALGLGFLGFLVIWQVFELVQTPGATTERQLWLANLAVVSVFGLLQRTADLLFR